MPVHETSVVAYVGGSSVEIVWSWVARSVARPQTNLILDLAVRYELWQSCSIALAPPLLISFDPGSFNNWPPLFDFGQLVCSESFRSLLLGGRNFLALIGELPAHRRVG